MREMLECVDSPELAEWMGFERAFGPIGHEWRDEMLARIHEELQLLNFLTGEINSEEDENPVPRPVRPPRPPDVSGIARNGGQKESQPEEETPQLPTDEYFA